jgi:chemotaxis protein MotB
VLAALAPVMRRMPNRLSVTGHTAAARPGTRPAGSAWDLSAGRAISVREILAANGLPDDRFAAVTGKAEPHQALGDLTPAEYLSTISQEIAPSHMG